MRREKITPEEFIKLFTETALEHGQFAKMYGEIVAAVPEAELSDKHFCEFLVLSLFIDYLCLRWTFTGESADKLRNLYVKKIISELGKTRPAYGSPWPVTCEGEFKRILDERFSEYQQVSSGISCINIDTQQTLDSLTKLGETFSRHFIGHENLETILKVKWFFLMKEDILYEKFLKGIKQDYELVL
ncbi:MAG: hypothetical protein Q8N82_08370 [Deltaproteobacteria bacterium]|nr:hypothetical protein [Deltaproteobacteria bacterium]